MSSNGSIIVEGEEGDVIFASSPGIVDDSRGSRKKAKPTTKRQLRYPLIEIFQRLADNEDDEIWKERFEKMAASKFPINKITYHPATLEENKLGKLIYKNRQVVETLFIEKDTDLEEISFQIKDFVSQWTNIDLEDEEIDEDNAHVFVDRTMVTRTKWDKLGPRDQTSVLTKYLNDFSRERGISHEKTEKFITNIIILNMGRGIGPYLTFGENGEIDRIKELRVDRGEILFPPFSS